MPSADWEQIGRDTTEIWNNGRFDLVDRVVAPEYVRHDPAFPDEVRGPEGYKRYVKAMMEPFPDGTLSVEDAIIGLGGDKAVVRYIWRATHTGDFMGIPPTGKKVELAGISIMRAEDGKLVECWDGYDSLSLMRQLGAVP
jgi:steroid delta-isomerase-like uncharacterized protein